ncbi:MAG: ral secretion pathway protein [Pseudomonadota bacterium]
MTAPTSALEDYLLHHALITSEALSRAQDAAKQSRVRLPAALSALGLVGEEALCRALSSLAGAPMLSRHELGVLRTLPAEINLDFLRERRVVPLALEAQWADVAMADPFDEDTRSSLEFAFCRPLRLRVAQASDIDDALAAPREDEIPPDASLAAQDLALISDKDSDAPVIREVSRLVAKALELRASDIHIEPQADALLVRFRIDGELGAAYTLPRRWAEPVASRLKLMARLDIAEKRLPQDGRLRLAVRGENIELRLASLPTLHGESLVLRLLGQQHVSLALDAIGMTAAQLRLMHSTLKQPYGVMLITGPTGSGKTTTLYAALNALRRPGVKIMTVEDPIEYSLPGLIQMQIKPEIGLDYATALKAILRSDPDVIMVGEIRDRETADIAIRAALTGHLVLATLHTHTAAGAVTRLFDLGVEDYLLASTLNLSVAQRLVRRLCAACQSTRPASDDERALFIRAGVCARDQTPLHLPKAEGCPQCQSRGFSARLPLFDMIQIDEAARGLVRAPFDESRLTASAAHSGVQDLWQQGLARVLARETTLEEVIAVAGAR